MRRPKRGLVLALLRRRLPCGGCLAVSQASMWWLPCCVAGFRVVVALLRHRLSYCRVAGVYLVALTCAVMGAHVTCYHHAAAPSHTEPCYC